MQFYVLHNVHTRNTSTSSSTILRVFNLLAFIRRFASTIFGAHLSSIYSAAPSTQYQLIPICRLPIQLPALPSVFSSSLLDNNTSLSRSKFTIDVLLLPYRPYSLPSIRILNSPSPVALLHLPSPASLFLPCYRHTLTHSYISHLSSLYNCPGPLLHSNFSMDGGRAQPNRRLRQPISAHRRPIPLTMSGGDIIHIPSTASSGSQTVLQRNTRIPPLPFPCPNDHMYDALGSPPSTPSIIAQTNVQLFHTTFQLPSTYRFEYNIQGTGKSSPFTLTTDVPPTDNTLGAV